MPSSTPNYGWTYPISSDDLNAGATSIGSLATGADASLKAASDLITNKVLWEGAPVNISTYAAYPTTDANGYFTLSGITPARSIVQCVGYLIYPYSSGWKVFYEITTTYGVITALTPRASATIGVYVMKW